MGDSRKAPGRPRSDFGQVTRLFDYLRSPESMPAWERPICCEVLRFDERRGTPGPNSTGQLVTAADWLGSCVVSCSTSQAACANRRA